jgi:hypothetical protein
LPFWNGHYPLLALKKPSGEVVKSEPPKREPTGETKA